MKKIILASASPRRCDLLKQIGLQPIIRTAEFAESMSQNCPPEQLVCENAYGKAAAVVKDLVNKSAIIIAADTIVALNHFKLGKPENLAAAKNMLRSLSGRRHEVISGVCVWDGETGKQLTRAVTTIVEMRTISDDEIAAYCATNEPYDKAGAYGIQLRAGLFVERIEGSYSNVVGLPLATVGNMLHELGYEVSALW